MRSEGEESNHHFSLVSLLAESDEDEDNNLLTEEDGISRVEDGRA